MFFFIEYLYVLIWEIWFLYVDWCKMMEFFIEVGYVSDEWCQEWVLLLDLLGVIVLIEEINMSWLKGVMFNIVCGLFYCVDVFCLLFDVDILFDGVGVLLWVFGVVCDFDGQLIVGVMIEIWQVNFYGFYENQQFDQ